MFADGYEAAGENHHKTTIDYVDVKMGEKARDAIGMMNRMRKKRHEAVYFSMGSISEPEAREAIEFAESFLALIKGKIGR